MNKSTINKQLMLMGFTPKHKGFYYLCRALTRLDSVADRELYSAYRSTCSDLPEGRKDAERCMTYAIRYAWDASRGGIRDMFPLQDWPPTPMEFVLVFHLLYCCEDQ